MNGYIKYEASNKYEDILRRVVARISANQSFFTPAVFFIATETNITSINEIGYIPKSLVEAKTFFHQHFIPETISSPYEDYRQIVVPIVADQNGETLFLGVIVQCTTESIPFISQYVEALSNGIGSSLYDTKYEITTEELLLEANYKMEFSRLAGSFIECCSKKQRDYELVIYKYKEKKLSPVGSSAQQLHSDIVLTKDLAALLLHRTENAVVLKAEQLTGEVDERKFAIFPIVLEGEIVAAIVFILSRLEHASSLAWVNKLVPLFQRGFEQEKLNEDEKRKDILMLVTKKFHSTMDIAEVLGEIVAAIKRVYPSFLVHLLISQEWKAKDDLPIKPFMYGSDQGNGKAEQAYLSGRIQVEHEADNGTIFLYAPLKGKQGVYGVMEIQTVGYSDIPKEEIDFIKMLADTGGIALENAELFQQSRKLIRDLQLINETSHQLNLNLRLSDTINFMTQQITESFGAEQVGFFIFQTNGEFIVLEGSSELFCQKSVHIDLESFMLKIKREKDSIFIGDTDLQDVNVLQGFKSVLAVPMIQNKELKGVVIAVHRNTNHFSFDNFKLLQSLVHHSTLAFTNSMLHEELEKLVITDHLTRLYSRNYLDECIQESLMKENQGTFLLLDIDNFKKVNDTYGHQVGDDIIIQVANVLKRNIRNDDIAARWGGEELAIYFPEIEIEVGLDIAYRILRAVELETSPRVTVSIGLSYWTNNDSKRSLQKLFTLADQGLYVAKETGKNRVVVK
ncbi:GGDEF domain protein [Halalkalibacter wakoensis JCM 9140]|uniref:GGDEF domain protein n=1 Tax=Halalkalibacter wakoensis JCM 9140 TaxID=1236970 RepID=W4Q269_9BACI|nr:sensor domain-containing diguanylate cyclase [Halalkalibacter wakoensis]GAE25828.1 GGDEF domain protein [Halalkalibacter wakoensis JCM 9140]